MIFVSIVAINLLRKIWKKKGPPYDLNHINPGVFLIHLSNKIKTPMNSICIDHETFNLSVSEIALAYPQSLSTLTRHNIDFCCGGKKSFRDACKKMGLNPEVIWNEIV